MRLIVLLSIVLGSCFMSIQAQDVTNTHPTILSSNSETVETTLNDESTSAVTPGNTVTELMTDTNLVHSEPTQDSQTSTEMEDSTAWAPTQPVTVIEQTTPKFVPELTTAEDKYTTPALETVTTTTMTEPATSDFMPTTSLHETTGGITSADLTSSGHQEYKITTATVAMTTASKEALDPTTIISKQPTDMTESPLITSQAVDITTEASSITSTINLISTPQFVQFELHPTTSVDDLLSTHSTPSTTPGGIVSGSVLPAQANWLLIIIVCAVIICVLFAFMILFAQRRKKTASQTFGPTMNGQSKKSNKKKGAGNDAWAGPVYLQAEEGVECDGEEQGVLMSGDGDGEDVVLSTFVALETDDTPNDGVGGDETKEAKKWEEQEPLLYIDEDVKEDNMEKTVGQEVNEKVANGEKTLNGGETFCITTAV